MRSPSAPALVPGSDLPMCQHFGTCGGCSLLDRPIAAQWAEKHDHVAALLAPFLDGIELGGQASEFPPLHFRTKLLYPVRPDARGRPSLGIYARRSHDLVRIEECRTQARALTEIGRRAEQILRDLRITPFDERDASGFVRAFHARLAPGTGELLLGVVTRPGVFDEGSTLANRLLEAAKLPAAGGKQVRAVGVVRSISERTDNFLLGERHVPLKGHDHVVDRQDGLEFRIGLGSFYQVHRAAQQVLYAPALAMAGDVTGQRVVDGYGGIGTFGLRFAKAGAARVEIVENGASSCRDARHNAERNGMADRVTVIEQPFADAEFAAEPDLLVVDPTRSGLGPDGCARVLAARPGRILHVACSAQALARDLEILTARGYRVAAAEVCDMFPHTEHVEVLTLLRPR